MSNFVGRIILLPVFTTFTATLNAVTGTMRKIVSTGAGDGAGFDMMVSGSEAGPGPIGTVFGGVDQSIGNASPPSLRMQRKGYFRCLWPVAVGERSFSIDVRYELAGFDHDGSVLIDPDVTDLRGIALENGSGFLVKETGDDNEIIQETFPGDVDNRPRLRVRANPFVGIFEDQFAYPDFNSDGEWTTITITLTVQVRGVLEVWLENVTERQDLRVNWDNIQVS